MDRTEVEVTVRHPFGDCIGPSVAQGGCDALQAYGLKARLGGIIRDQLGAVARDGGLALRVQGRGDDEQPALLVEAPLQHRGNE